MIDFKNVCKTYKTKKGIKTKALEDVSFTLPDKGMVFILGKSGSGKSTLLNILGGLDKYDQGEVIIDGKSTKKFRTKDFDYYRNTYLGFVFQEFNLIDEYSVFENINISLKIQKQKNNPKVVEEMLNKVGLEGLSNRKTNELSGGQKQRVAIARALIKNPDMILADEPTGSLDQETGKQILELLKEISKDKLVIIVSHDRESALNYNDMIIEIEDGKIINNTTTNDSIPTKAFKYKKSSLPWLTSFKLGLLNLKAKKIKLIFTILLVFMSLSFFGISKVFSEYDVAYSHTQTMINEKEENITIKKASYSTFDNTWYESGSNQPLESEDISNITKKLNTPYYIGYTLNENNRQVSLKINRENIYTSKQPAYYVLVGAFQDFIEADSSYIDQKILGKYPTAHDEIMIHSYVADAIIYSGVLQYNLDKKNTNDVYYKPTSYQQIIDEGVYLKLGSAKVKISGIIIDNTDKYQILKTLSLSKLLDTGKTSAFGTVKYEYNYNEFTTEILSKASDIYVAKDFSKNIALEKNITINQEKYSIKTIYKEKQTSLSTEVGYLPSKKLIYNGTKETSIDKLNDNEILVGSEYLNDISNNEYSKQKEAYITAYNKTIDDLRSKNSNIEEKNREKLQNYIEQLKESNLTGNQTVIEEPVLEDLLEINEKSDQELTNEFIKKYAIDNKIINSETSLKIKEIDSDNGHHNYLNLKIVGILLEDDNNIYIPSNIASSIISSNYTPCTVNLKISDNKELSRILKIFPTDKKEYLGETAYSPIINQMINTLNYASKIFFYISIIFGIFAFILLTSFIVSSIYYSKKTIGILRGLGARKIDVFKIFIGEELIIGIVSLILTTILIILFVGYVNDYIENELLLNIDFIIFNVKTLLTLTIGVISIIILSSIITASKIVSMKPIDAINNK